MNWSNVSLIVLGLSAFGGAFFVALWISLVVWTFRDMRSRSRDAFAQLLAALMAFVLGPFGALLYLLLRPRETLAEKYERSLEEEALLQDIEERHICPGCKQPIEPDFVLCPVCHTRLRQPCVHCARLIHPRWDTCPYCAKGQQPIPGADKAGRVTLLDLEKEERKLPELDMDVAGPVLDLEAELEPVDEPVSPAAGQGYGDLEEEWTPLADEDEDENDLSDLFSATGESPGVEPTAQQDSSAGTEVTTDESPRRPLSLFRRT